MDLVVKDDEQQSDQLPNLLPRPEDLMAPAAARTPLRELIVDLDDVADWAIPYAHMPRWTQNAYSAKYRRWSDVAEQTVHSLRTRPVLTESTLLPLLLAAQDAVAKSKRGTTIEPVGATAAVRRLLDTLADRDRAVLSARLFTPRPLTQAAVARQLGVSQANIQTHQPRMEARLAELLADPLHHEVAEHAAALGRRLGPYLPTGVVVTELGSLDVDPDSEAAWVLLHLAGRYVRSGDWFESTTTGGERRVAAVVDDVFAHQPAPTTKMLIRALTDIGMPKNIARTYMRTRPDWRRITDRWVRWGDTAPSMAEAVLHARGEPATFEEIHAAIGARTATLKSVREAIYRDQRFVRNTRQTWGLRVWGLYEFGGIAEEIGARIDTAGGATNVDDLVADLRARFPDIAESSIKLNLATLAFITEGTLIRRRRETDAWPQVAPFYTARGAFRNGPNEIRLAMLATDGLLRGSGRPIHPSVATAIGVLPGQRRTFVSAHGPIEVAWRLTSTNGPSIGSLRIPAEDAGARLEDTLVLAFNLDDEASLHITRIGTEVDGMIRLRQLLGRPVRSPDAALAASLGCKRTEVAAVLRERGDADLADLADPGTTE